LPAVCANPRATIRREGQENRACGGGARADPGDFGPVIMPLDEALAPDAGEVREHREGLASPAGHPVTNRPIPLVEVSGAANLT